jgi:hypothetical protein
VLGPLDATERTKLFLAELFNHDRRRKSRILRFNSLSLDREQAPFIGDSLEVVHPAISESYA